MTAAQNRVYQAIRKLILAHGHCPSFEEIGRATRLRSLSTVSKHVHALCDEGYLTHEYNKGRDLALAPDKVFPGYSACRKGHERILYQSKECPLCTLIAERAREVKVGSS